MDGARRSTNLLPAMPIALMVVGLGMVLIAALAGVVLWFMTRRRPTAGPQAHAAPELHGAGEPAEA